MRRRLADPHKLRSRPKWSSDEEVELWAELDKLLLHQIGKLSPTIIWEKLKVALRKRKPKQIEGKLYAMWRKHTGSDSRELFLQDVCTIGSKSLTKLDESTRLKIQAKLEAMHEAELYSPRKTRSISANSRVEPILFLRDQTIASGHGRSGKRASTEQVETPTRHTSDSNKQPMIKVCGIRRDSGTRLEKSVLIGDALNRLIRRTRLSQPNINTILDSAIFVRTPASRTPRIVLTFGNPLKLAVKGFLLRTQRMPARHFSTPMNPETRQVLNTIIQHP